MDELNILVEKLMKAYYKKGKIGRVKPWNTDHAKQIAYATAVRILHSKEIEKDIEDAQLKLF